MNAPMAPAMVIGNAPSAVTFFRIANNEDYMTYQHSEGLDDEMGSALDADARKLEAMGAVAGATIEDIDPPRCEHGSYGPHKLLGPPPWGLIYGHCRGPKS